MVTEPLVLCCIATHRITSTGLRRAARRAGSHGGQHGRRDSREHSQRNIPRQHRNWKQWLGYLAHLCDWLTELTQQIDN